MNKLNKQIAKNVFTKCEAQVMKMDFHTRSSNASWLTEDCGRIVGKGGEAMNQGQELQIAGYYSTAGKYIYNKCYSNRHRMVFTKEADKYQWLVVEQGYGKWTEARQTDRCGKIIARDTYILKKGIPVCMGAERLCKDSKSKIYFSANDIRVICHYGTSEKLETYANLSKALVKIREKGAKQHANIVLRKLNALAEGSCMEFLAVIEKQKLASRCFDNQEVAMR